MSDAQLIHFSREQIRKGSKSFAAASFFLSEKEKSGAWLLYSWCRHCDDEIDHAQSPEEAVQKLLRLREQTLLAFANTQVMDSPQFEGLRLLFQATGLPVQYPLDLLRGMQMDVEGYWGRSEDELLDYCYCVAGVVGLMMCHVMNVSDERALAHAVDLGQAMQLTNISRDIDADLKLGRVYIPREWLARDGLAPEDLTSPWTRPLWPRYTKQLLALAEDRYDSGRQGLHYLSFRAAWAVSIALGVYRAIGTKVLDRGSRAWDQRCYTTRFEKAVIILQESVLVFVRFLPRLVFRWKPTPITSVFDASMATSAARSRSLERN
ncbi:MAG: phytoene/squalene synthase family protein [Bdellovibrio sp.]